MKWGVVGRERELEAIAAAFDRAGEAQAVVLEGAAGIGKTTVWRAAVERARESGHTVLSCRTAQTEGSLPFVGLADLLEPVVDGALATLPAAQRVALETALARVEPTETFGRLAVSRAVLAVLRERAQRAPLMIAIDDVQWLDAATGSLLEFALRRVADATVRVLVSQRTGESPADVSMLAGVPVDRIPIGPLSAEGFSRLISARTGGSLPRPRLLELHRMTAGNPYFGLEIARALTERGATIAPDEPLPVPRDIAVLLRDRVEALSGPAVEVVVLAAASSQPTAELLAAVSGRPDGVEEALAAGILETDRDRVRFTHPLLASVIYAGADATTLRQAHRRLAEAAAADSEDRALHLARATLDRDESIARELDAAARRAYRRGAPAPAAELAQHAHRLTPETEPEARLTRSSATAEYLLAAGDTVRGRVMLEQLLELYPSGPDRARVALRLGTVRYLTDDVVTAHILFGDALADSSADERLRAEALQARAFTAMLGGDIPHALQHARSSLDLAERFEDPRALALASSRVGLCELLAGNGFDRALFERATALEEGLDDLPFEWLPSFAYAGAAAMADDLSTAGRLYERLTQTAFTFGDERAIPTIQFARSEYECRRGNWADAVRRAREAVELSRQLGLNTLSAWALHADALVHAHIGDADAARSAANQGLAAAHAAGAIAQISQITSTLGFLELSLGDPAAASVHLDRLAEMIAHVGLAEPGVVRFVPNHIEALIALGELDRARGPLALLRERATSLDRVSARAAAARCQAMLAAADDDLEQAQTSAAEAVAQHARIDEPFELGRTLLVQGSIERRSKQRAAARETLTRALELFDSLGAALWAEKSAAELARIPGRAPSNLSLSETEQRVASLVAEGLSNKEIARRLFVTVRTVEAHLTNIYAKLGVRSRMELAGKLRSPMDAQARL